MGTRDRAAMRAAGKALNRALDLLDLPRVPRDPGEQRVTEAVGLALGKLPEQAKIRFFSQVGERHAASLCVSAFVRMGTPRQGRALRDEHLRLRVHNGGWK